MNFEQWSATERKALEAIREFSAMGIRVPTGRGTPLTTAGILAYQTSRAFDAMPDDDEIPEDGDDERDDEAAYRQQCHRALDRIIDRKRGRTRRPASDLERQQSALRKTLTTAPAFNCIPPWERSGRAADAEPENDLEYFQRCAAACNGGVF